MTKVNVALVLAVLLPVASFGLPALAASAHNLQTGAQTSNAYDTAESALLKQMHRDRTASFRLLSTDAPAK